MVVLSKFLSAALVVAASVTIAVHVESHPHQQRQKSIISGDHGHFIEAATAAGGVAAAGYVASNLAAAPCSEEDGKEDGKIDGKEDGNGLSLNANKVEEKL